jgi:NitT/TauT family transport system ATP-binding protein
MTSASILSIKGVSKSFDAGPPILRDVHLDVEAGQFVSIVGATGCGKSTLLRLIASLDTPDVGQISFNGCGVEFLFQDPTLLPWRTLLQNVSLPLEIGSRTDHAEHDVTQAIASVGLTDHIHKYPHELSGGMRMRTSLARSLIRKADLYLFDEPFSAVDEITREKLHLDLLRLHHAKKFSSIFVTHNINEAVFLSDVIVILGAPNNVLPSVRGVVDIPFGRERDENFRFDSNFTELCRRIHSELELASK